MASEKEQRRRLEADVIQCAQGWATLHSLPGGASRVLMVAEARLAGAVSALRTYLGH